MDQLKKRFNLFYQALDTLDDVIEKFEDMQPTDFYYEEIRDSTIQRFEYSLDTFWKLLKYYLETVSSLPTVASPKAVLNLAKENLLITSSEFETSLDMVNDRNLASHAYNKELAEAISKAIPNYYNLMDTIAKRIEQGSKS